MADIIIQPEVIKALADCVVDLIQNKIDWGSIDWNEAIADAIKSQRIGDDRIYEIADHYELDTQLNILQEECAELIQAASKYRRNGSVDIIEEIADVYIMLDQIVYLLDKKHSVDVYKGVSLWMEKKVRRQMNRMGGDPDA